MKTVIADKVASITQACNLGQKLHVATDNIPALEGTVLVVEVLTSKSTYNTLELTSGRMAKVAKGDIIVGALGHRNALFGYSGYIPEQVKEGDIINILNLGGVLGICNSVNPEFGQPFECRVLGVVLQFPYLGERIGVPASVGYQPLDYDAVVDTQGVPVVGIAGSCMEAGKTAAAIAIVSQMKRRGLKVHAFKATGVSLRRDIIAMEDAGAEKSMIFTDLGVVTTSAKNGPAITRMLLTEMAKDKPDVIVFELGDGILGAYGVQAILSSPDISKVLSGVVLSANDPVAAWGGVKMLRENFKIEPIAVTGPATDNAVGINIIKDQMKVAAFNSLAHGAELGDHIIQTLGLKPQAARKADAE